MSDLDGSGDGGLGASMDGGLDGEETDHKAYLGLRIAAIFILLVTSAIGATAPHIVNRVEFASKKLFFRVAKSYAAGVVLATGLIHMMPEAQENLEAGFGEDVEFPFSALFALGAILLTLSIEQIAAEYFERLNSAVDDQKTSEVVHRMHSHRTSDQQPPSSSPPDAFSSFSPIGEFTSTTISSNVELITPNQVNGYRIVEQPKSRSSTPPLDLFADHGHSHSHNHKQEGNHGHSHGHMDLLSKMDMNQHARSFVIAHVLELGIAFHSVIIGITLGVTTSFGELRALICALVFHQFFEGFALGSSILEANMKGKIYPFVMGIFFAITTPIGVAIGIGISSTYDEGSTKAQLTQGTFDSVSGGILIYMALVDLVSEEFRTAAMDKEIPFLRLKMLLSLTFGAGCMAMLAIWA